MQVKASGRTWSLERVNALDQPMQSKGPVRLMQVAFTHIEGPCCWMETRKLWGSQAFPICLRLTNHGTAVLIHKREKRGIDGGAICEAVIG